MNCLKIKKYISLYIDGELSETQISEIHEHINNCNDCKVYFDTIKNVSSAIQIEKNEIQPDISDNEIMRYINRNVRKESYRLNYIFKPVAVVAVILLLVISPFIINNSNIEKNNINQNVNIATNGNSKETTSDFNIYSIEMELLNDMYSVEDYYDKL